MGSLPPDGLRSWLSSFWKVGTGQYKILYSVEEKLNEKLCSYPIGLNCFLLLVCCYVWWRETSYKGITELKGFLVMITFTILLLINDYFVS